MKFFKWLILIFIWCSCSQHKVYDENDYFLIKLDSSDNKISSKILVNRFDTSRTLVLLYWDNGKVMSKAFFKGKLRDGINQYFYIYGNLQISEIYKNGKKEGPQMTYYPNGRVKSEEKYSNGKLILLKSYDSLGDNIK